MANPKRVASLVVTLPAEIDIANSDDVYMEICSAITSGTMTVVADLTETTFCDCSGARESAMPGGTRWRLVSNSGS
jgi:anti-anti-sigma regulatory factor